MGCKSSRSGDWDSSNYGRQEINSLTKDNLHKAGTLLDLDDMNKRIEVDPTNAAETLSHLGNVCLNQNKFIDAKNFFEKALKIYEKSHGSDHISVAETKLHLGKTMVTYGKHEAGFKFWSGINFLSEKKFKEAKEFGEAALTIYRATYGEEALETAKATKEHGDILSANEMYSEADELYQKAMKIYDANMIFNSTVSPRGTEVLFESSNWVSDFSLAGGNGMHITVFDLHKGGILDRGGVKVGMELFKVKEGMNVRNIQSSLDIEDLMSSLQPPLTMFFRETSYYAVYETKKNWAVSRSEADAFNEARSLFEKSIKLSEFLYSDKSNELAEVEKEYGFCLQKEGKFEEAYTRYASAFRFHEKQTDKIIKELDQKMAGLKGKILSDDRLAFPAFLMMGMATSLTGSARTVDASAHAERALKLMIKCYGPEHPGVAMAHNILGTNLYVKKEYMAALPHFKDAAKAYQISLEEHHPAAIHSMANQASCLARNKPGLGIAAGIDGPGAQYEEAIKIFEECLDHYHQQALAEHNSVAIINANIGSIYLAMGSYSKAKEYFLKSLELREKILKQDHCHIALSCLHLAKVTYHEAAYEDAMGYATRALGIFQQALPWNAEVVAAVCIVQANCELKMGNLSTAFEKFGQCKKIREEQLDKQKSRLLLVEACRFQPDDASKMFSTALTFSSQEGEGEEEDLNADNKSETSGSKSKEEGTSMEIITEGADESAAVEEAEDEELAAIAQTTTDKNHKEKKPQKKKTKEQIGEMKRIKKIVDQTSDVVITEEEEKSCVSFASSVTALSTDDARRKGMAGRVAVKFSNAHMDECVGVCAEWTDLKSAQTTLVKIPIEVIPDNHCGKAGVSKPLPKSKCPYVLIFQQGQCSFVEKAIASQEIGAIGFIVFRKEVGKPFVMSHTTVNAEPPDIPGIMVSQEVGEKLYGACMAGKNPTIECLVKNKRSLITTDSQDQLQSLDNDIAEAEEELRKKEERKKAREDAKKAKEDAKKAKEDAAKKKEDAAKKKEDAAKKANPKAKTVTNKAKSDPKKSSQPSLKKTLSKGSENENVNNPITVK